MGDVNGMLIIYEVAHVRPFYWLYGSKVWKVESWKRECLFMRIQAG
jgi:hypothetical protein